MNELTPAGIPRAHEIDGVGALVRGTLDVMPYAVVLLHADGRCRYANPAAQAELGPGRALALDNDRLQGVTPGDTQRLRDALAQALSQGRQRLLTLRAPGGSETALTIVPLQAPDDDRPAGAAVYFSRRRLFDELSTDAYARDRRLTDAELRVLKAICAGVRPTDIAKAHRVRISTVRTQIGSIRQKTGAGTIGDLVRLVACLPPMLNRCASRAPAPQGGWACPA